MTRNVTDAAVLLGAMTGIDPNRPRHRRPEGPRLPGLHAVPRQARPERRPDRRLARGHLRPDHQPRGRRDPRTTRSRRSGAGRDRRRQHADPDRARLRPGVHGAPVRVQDGHRHLPRRPTPTPLPEDAPGPDRLQQRPSGPRRALELGHLRPGPGDRRPRRSRLPGGRAQEATSTAQTGDRRHPRGQPPRRDHRADERAGLGHRPGQRRPRWRLLDLRRILESVRDRRLRRHHRPGRLRRPSAGRRLVHRRTLGRAGAHRLRLRLRAGDPRPGEADVPGPRDRARCGTVNERPAWDSRAGP